MSHQGYRSISSSWFIFEFFSTTANFCMQFRKDQSNWWVRRLKCSIVNNKYRILYTCSGGSEISQTEGTYYLAGFLLKTAWKCKNFFCWQKSHSQHLIGNNFFRSLFPSPWNSFTLKDLGSSSFVIFDWFWSTVIASQKLKINIR